MNWKHWLGIAGGVLLLVFTFLAISTIIEKKVALARAEEDIKARDEANQKLDQKVKDLDAKQAARDAAFQAKEQQLTLLIAGIKTTQQAVAALPQVAPNLSQPVHVVTPEEAKSPNAPSYIKQGDAVVGGQDLISITKKLGQCDLQEATLGKCQADLTDSRARVVLSDERAKNNEQIAKDWEKAAKGGSWIKRTLKKAKVVACAVGGGGLGATADKQHPVRGGAIGAGAGALMCSLF